MMISVEKRVLVKGLEIAMYTHMFTISIYSLSFSLCMYGKNCSASSKNTRAQIKIKIFRS